MYFSGPKCRAFKDLRGKWAVVTGSSSGIGKTTALELARMGCNIVFACRSEARTKEAIEWIRAETQGSK